MSFESSAGILVLVPFEYWSALSSQKCTSFSISCTHRQCSNARTCSNVDIWSDGTPSVPAFTAWAYDWPSVLSDSSVVLSNSKKIGLGKILTQCVSISKNRLLKTGLYSGSLHLFPLINCNTKLTSSLFSSLILYSFCTLPTMPTRLSSASST